MQIHIAAKNGVKGLCSSALFYGNLASFSLNIPSDNNTEKIALTFARTSALFNPVSTYPYQRACQWMATRVFTKSDLAALFGPSTILELNPYHPRHFFSLIGFLLGLGSFLLVIYENYSKKNTNVNLLPFATFNVFCTRPFLHLANQVTKL